MFIILSTFGSVNPLFSPFMKFTLFLLWFPWQYNEMWKVKMNADSEKADCVLYSSNGTILHIVPSAKPYKKAAKKIRLFLFSMSLEISHYPYFYIFKWWEKLIRHILLNNNGSVVQHLFCCKVYTQFILPY